MMYGTVTKSDGHFNNGTCYAFQYTVYRDSNSSASAHSGKTGAWIQYNYEGNRPLWLYKSQIRPTYINTSAIVRAQGVLADGTVVNLSDDVSFGSVGSGHNNDPTPIIHKPNSYKCVAFRFLIVESASIYFNGGKVWGK